MGRKRNSKTLYVYMNGYLVGNLMQQSNGVLKFCYDPNWLGLENACAISLSLPLAETTYEGNVVQNYFDNLLPDSNQIRQRIQARFKIDSNTSFDLLANIGADCIGALQLLTEPLIADPTIINAIPITDLGIAEILNSYMQAPLGMQQNSEFRISLAGAQEKSGLLWYNNSWQQPYGTTPTTHIVKLPIGYIQHANINLSDSVENEWLCLQILAAYNLPVNKAQIKNFADQKTLVLERFDRRWINTEKFSQLIRIPQEDLCQALAKPATLKYEADGGPGIVPIMQVLNGCYTAVQDRDQFMKTVFLFWILAAIDGHAKNFSILLEQKSRYKLSPIYDVISAYPLITNKQLELKKIKMAMAVQGTNRHYAWYEFKQRHWLTTAKATKFSEIKMQTIISEVLDNMEQVINTVTHNLPVNFPEYIAATIFNGMRHAKNII